MPDLSKAIYSRARNLALLQTDLDKTSPQGY